MEDFEDEVTTAEEKALYDKQFGVIVGAVFSWEETSKTLKKERQIPEPSGGELFAREIPLQTYLSSDTNWLDEERLKVYCIVRCVKLRLVAGSSGFQLSKSFIGTTRHSSERTGQYYATRADATTLIAKYVSSLIKSAPLLETKKIDFSFYDELIPNLEKVPKSSAVVDIKFDFSVMSNVITEDETLDGGDDVLPHAHPYVVPSNVDVEPNEPVIVIGYPRKITEQYLLLTYGTEAPPKEAFDDFFEVGKKVASLGKIKDISPHFMTISNATCSGMSGSPVFTFSGKLLGFLVGSKDKIKHNIVIRVDHPVFVIEYLIYAGMELLDTKPLYYSPLLELFAAKHIRLLKKAINNGLLADVKRKRLKSVLFRLGL